MEKRKHATAAQQWVPAFAGTTDYHIHKHSNAIALVTRGGRGQGRYSYLRASSITLPSLGSVPGATSVTVARSLAIARKLSAIAWAS